MFEWLNTGTAGTCSAKNHQTSCLCMFNGSPWKAVKHGWTCSAPAGAKQADVFNDLDGDLWTLRRCRKERFLVGKLAVSPLISGMYWDISQWKTTEFSERGVPEWTWKIWTFGPQSGNGKFWGAASGCSVRLVVCRVRCLELFDFLSSQIKMGKLNWQNLILWERFLKDTTFFLERFSPSISCCRVQKTLV